MISFRHHLVTLVAVFLALAAGIVLGGGPLSDVGDQVTGTTEQPSPAASTTQDDDFGDAYAGATAARVYAGRLDQHSVVVVSAPGASSATVSALTKQVQAAGGKVVGTATMGDTLLDPTEKNLVDTLGSQMRTQVAPGLVPASATTYDRMGRLMAAAVGTTTVSASPSAQISSIRESLAGAELMTFASAKQPTAPLVLVVLGDQADPAIVGGLVTGLAAASRGVVVAAPTRDGTLTQLRADGIDQRATLVDGDERAPGQVAVAAALIQALTKPGGSFGASGADGVLPLG